MVKRVLVTTPLPEAFPKDNVPLLFLGEWCKSYPLAECLNEIDTIVLPYHWDDRTKLYSDYEYLKEFYERVLLILSRKLNEIHKVNHTLRYWRILIGPWLGFFIQSLFDRWTCIKSAENTFDLSGTVILDIDEREIVPNDMVEFINFFTNDSWNHYIYAYIIQHHTKIPVTIVKHASGQKELTEVSKEPVKYSLAQKVKKATLNLFFKLTSLFAKPTDFFFLSSYLPLVSEIRLQLKLGQVPQIFNKQPMPSFQISDRRSFTLEGEVKSTFEAFIYTISLQQIPAAYLEGYHDLVAYTRQISWPRAPKLIWTSNSFESDDVFKAWASEKVEAGSRLAIGQHGGHYGIAQWSFTEEHEIQIADYYFSWGWAVLNQPKIIAIGMIKGILPVVRKKVPTKLLHITTLVPRYSYWMYSTIVGPQYLYYLEDQFSFFTNLHVNIKQQSILRLFSEDKGWNQKERWKNRHPDLNIVKDDAEMTELYSESKLVVCTYNATAYLETFTLNIPTIIFWNPSLWEIRESAQPFFEELKRVGIFHETPQSAATYVNQIWDDVEGWWFSEDVQKIIQRFCMQYAFQNRNLISDIAKIVKNENCTV